MCATFASGVGDKFDNLVDVTVYNFLAALSCGCVEHCMSAGETSLSAKQTRSLHGRSYAPSGCDDCLRHRGIKSMGGCHGIGLADGSKEFIICFVNAGFCLRALARQVGEVHILAMLVYDRAQHIQACMQF